MKLRTILALSLFLFVAGLGADEVTLKNGQSFTNVLAIIQYNHVNIVTEDGKLLTFPKREVRSIANRQVAWEKKIDRKKLDERIKRRIERIVKEYKQKESVRIEREKQIRKSALWRSAILPGWGQLYKQEEIKALSIFGGFMSLGGTFVSAWNSYRRAESRYNSADLPALLGFADRNLVLPLNLWAWLEKESAREESRKYGRLASGAGFLTACLYAYNVIDAYFLGSARAHFANEPQARFANAMHASRGRAFFEWDFRRSVGPENGARHDDSLIVRFTWVF